MSKKRFSLLIIRVIADLMAVTCAWVLAYLIRFHSWMPIQGPMPQKVLYFKLIPFILIIWFIVLAGSGFYHRTLRRRRSAFMEALDVVQSCLLATIALIAFTYFYEEYRYSRITIILFSVLNPAAVITVRSLIRKMLRIYRRNKATRQILIIGSGDPAVRALSLPYDSEVDTSKTFGIIAIGNDDDLVLIRDAANQRGIALLDQPQEWTKFFMEHPIHGVVVRFTCYCL